VYKLNDNEFLEHVGILGMKWGRKKVRTSDDHNKKVSLKGKKINEMTNAELKSFNERLQLERQYKQLTQSEINPGKKFVNDLLTSTAKQVAANYITKYATKELDQLFKVVK
jgi:hypothetical protein